jgi:hypothetical protein
MMRLSVIQPIEVVLKMYIYHVLRLRPCGRVGLDTESTNANYVLLAIYSSGLQTSCAT